MLAPLAKFYRRCRHPRRGQLFSHRAADNAARVRTAAAGLRNLSDKQLAQNATELREHWKGFGHARTLIEAAGLAVEGFRRESGIELHDVQVHAGLLLTQGCIAEMQTGEGKTFTVGLGAFIAALSGMGVHVATTNSYLAERDSQEVRPVLELLGVSVGTLPSEHDEPLKRLAYRCDVTYGTGYDFGFDYLRDQLRLRFRRRRRLGTEFLQGLRHHTGINSNTLQRHQGIAIVDEADCVLIDEAAMPLILSGAVPRRLSDELYRTAMDTARDLVDESDYSLDPATRSIRFSDSGWLRLHAPLKTSSVSGLTMPWADYVESSLRAIHCLRRDVDYVVVDQAVHIVDPNTGRVHEERSWRGGLHQAVECKESVPLSPERLTDGQISRQRYFRLYQRLAGVTGTAAGNEQEFREFYGLDVRSIPTNLPSRRLQLADRFFASDELRNRALGDEAAQRQNNGQPVLIGTQTIEHSQSVSKVLTINGVDHQVLNGLQDRAEADVISRAGVAGTVTVATNMAGRGTDIRPDERAQESGGLFVVAAEHHTSPRVDRQLIGRTARQGQPGAFRFYVASSDRLLREGKEVIASKICARADESGECHIDYSRTIAELQNKLEREAFEKRKAMVRRDEWMDRILESLVSEG